MTSDSPGIPVVRASIILISRLEGELALCEAFKDGLSSHLDFQLCKRTGEKSPQNKRSKLGLVGTMKLIYFPIYYFALAQRERTHEKTISIPQVKEMIP